MSNALPQERNQRCCSVNSSPTDAVYSQQVSSSFARKYGYRISPHSMLLLRDANEMSPNDTNQLRSVTYNLIMLPFTPLRRPSIDTEN